MNIKRFTGNLVLTLTILLTVGFARANASTINVPTGGSIQAAIDAASPGDTIQVAPGTYIENIVINKWIILQGAGPASTIIKSASPSVSVVTITAGGIDAVNRLILKDLRITGATLGDDSTGSGIYYATGPLGFTTFDTITVDNNSGNGISIESQNPLVDIVIQNSNLLQNGNAGLRTAAICPSIDALKILNSHLDFNGGGLTVYSHVVTNWEIRNSTFNDNSGTTVPTGGNNGGYGIAFDGIDNLNNIIIACSEFSRNKGNEISTGILMLSLAKPSINVSYTNVTITNSLFDSNALNGIVLQPDDNTVMDGIGITCSIIKNSGDTGVVVGFSGTPTNISIQHSDIFNNVYAGVWNQNAATIDARNNWWGSASGPRPDGIGLGTGDAIYGAVDFDPFLTSPSACASTCGPAITIVKKTNGTDNDVAPGQTVEAGSTVNWTYLVTNTGNEPLTNVTVTDDKGVAVTCPGTMLAIGESMTCTASGSAVAGQYTNIGSVTGTPLTGPNVTASNPDNYFGSAPGISIVKKTNGTDNDSAPGPIVAVGSTVTWTYYVKNTGNVPLTNVTVTDDKIGAIACPKTTLAIGESMTCTKTGTAVAGQYTNIGTVTAKPPVGSNVTASNPDNYFGSAPGISIVKKTNGTDNNTAPGPTVAVGSTVTWTYTITNTGNVALTNVILTDNKIVGAISCPKTTLAVGESMTCTKTGTAIAGQYTNIGTATGKPPVGSNVTASNPDNYFGVMPCTGKIGDFVWNDLNANGIQDKGEPGIGSVQVKLLNSSGTVVQTTTTNSSGYYQFTAVCGGTYKVVAVTPAGYSPTPSLIGSNRAIDSNGSPATVTLATSSSTDLTVDFGFVKYAIGYTTYTQGGWGSVPSGSNPGWLLATYFKKVYPGGYVIVGGTKYLKFTSAYAIQVFLPNGSTAGVLTASLTNPTTSSAGVFASQVLALRLNVDFSAAGIKKVGLGGLKVISGPLAGYTVTQVLTLANTVLGGNTAALPAGLTVSGLSNIVDAINNNFDGGTTNKGYLR